MFDTEAALFEQWILYCLDGSTFEEWLAHKRGPDLDRKAGSVIPVSRRYSTTYVELNDLHKKLYDLYAHPSPFLAPNR